MSPASSTKPPLTSRTRSDRAHCSASRRRDADSDALRGLAEIHRIARLPELRANTLSADAAIAVVIAIEVASPRGARLSELAVALASSLVAEEGTEALSGLARLALLGRSDARARRAVSRSAIREARFAAPLRAISTEIDGVRADPTASVELGARPGRALRGLAARGAVGALTEVETLGRYALPRNRVVGVIDEASVRRSLPRIRGRRPRRACRPCTCTRDSRCRRPSPSSSGE